MSPRPRGVTNEAAGDIDIRSSQGRVRELGGAFVALGLVAVAFHTMPWGLLILAGLLLIFVSS